MVEDRYLTSTAFVHHGYTNPITETGLTIHQDGVDVLDTGVLSDAVVGDIVVDIIQAHIVAHLHIVKHGVVDTRRHGYASRQLKLLTEYTQSDVSGEACVAHIGRVETLFD